MIKIGNKLRQRETFEDGTVASYKNLNIVNEIELLRSQIQLEKKGTLVGQEKAGDQLNSSSDQEELLGDRQWVDLALTRTLYAANTLICSGDANDFIMIVKQGKKGLDEIKQSSIDNV